MASSSWDAGAVTAGCINLSISTCNFQFFSTRRLVLTLCSWARIMSVDGFTYYDKSFHHRRVSDRLKDIQLAPELVKIPASVPPFIKPTSNGLVY